MATKTIIKSKRLVYEDTGVTVKQSDSIILPELGTVVVVNIHAARKKSGTGRVTLQLADGTTQEYSPAIINAVWI